ncbi:GNAT family N-acetyltransferase [Thermosediminibacter litoriperuensis]|uniref:Acetyltransferase (GNAT) family protein n=1 Tax=Thermosediminibacter litoriperuensis TaxID=291989 RepID=A0A5S5ALV7_9FIRM|nr:GNAT family N-acetyltransferase [Thermosediminibacter litoriperuensis]TYP52407.1 acetyltransferase (GNAT) family protein [Thermosediminibacter litoriperuensis]
MKIREAMSKDIYEIVKVHQDAFKGFLMTLLGPKFLMSYYQLVFEYSKRIFYVIIDEQNKVRGFVAGFLEPSQFYNLLRKRKWKLALAALFHLVFHPSLWLRVYSSLNRAVNLANSECDFDIAELASIAVDPKISGQGLGKELVFSFLNKARKMGARRVYLNTDALNNDKVNAFYQKIGFKLAHKFTVANKRLMNEYVYFLN